MFPNLQYDKLYPHEVRKLQSRNLETNQNRSIPSRLSTFSVPPKISKNDAAESRRKNSCTIN